MSIIDTSIGEGLSPLVKPPVTQDQLRRYANASGDFNPIHLDAEAARRVGLDGVIAHGMLSMAFLGQFIHQQIIAIPGARLANLHVRFANMVRLGDTLTCHGIVKERTVGAASIAQFIAPTLATGAQFIAPNPVDDAHDGRPEGGPYDLFSIRIECWAKNQKGTIVTSGEAIVIVPMSQREESTQ